MHSANKASNIEGGRLENRPNEFLFVSRYQMEVNFTPEPFYVSTHWMAFAMYTYPITYR
jgi:hypothetical protein